MEHDIFNLSAYSYRWLNEDISARIDDFQKRIPIAVPNSTIAWKSFWDDVKLLHAYAEEELKLSRSAVEEVIQRIEAIVDAQKGNPLHEIEIEALQMGTVIAWRAWSQRKYEYKTLGWDTPSC